MSDPIVAPDVVRFSMNGDLLGRPCVNMLDMVVLDERVSPDRAEAIEGVAEKMIDGWCDNILGALTVNYAFNSVTWVDLNSLDGSTGIRTSSESHTLPQAGGATGQSYGANSAVLVTKVATSARGQRSGRWFLPAVTEQFTDGNFVTSAYLEALQTACSDYLEQMTQTSPVSGIQFFPTVVHTKNEGTKENPDIVYVGNNQIHDLQPQQRIASQRRRNRP